MNLALPPNEYYQCAQADALAAAILMPKEETLRQWYRHESIDWMVEYFGVPADAVVARLNLLGIKP